MKHLILKIIARIFCLITTIRNWAYDKALLNSYTCKLPIFCSGNVAVGGSGKSPFAQFLVSTLLQMNKKPVILMRGYKGYEKGPYLVKKDDSIEKVGDEALMHLNFFKGQIPIIISKKRAAGAEFIVSQKIGDSIVLDDGLQHRALKKDVNFLLLDTAESKPWDKRELLPLGRLRETFSGALQRSHAIVHVKKNESNTPNIVKSELPTFNLTLSPSALYDLNTEERFSIDVLEKRKVKSVSAIAKPNSFFNLLEELKIEVISQHPFPDHHTISSNEYRTIENNENSLIITTTKDALKLKKYATKPEKIFVLELAAELKTPNEHSSLKQLLKTAIDSKAK